MVWARDSDGGEWGNPLDSPFHQTGTRKWHSHIVRNAESDKEGYSGEPTSFIDVNDPSIANLRRRHEEKSRNEFRSNMNLVAGLIQRGVVMPTEGMVSRAVEKLRRIASGV